MWEESEFRFSTKVGLCCKATPSERFGTFCVYVVLQFGTQSDGCATCRSVCGAVTGWVYGMCRQGLSQNKPPLCGVPHTASVCLSVCVSCCCTADSIAQFVFVTGAMSTIVPPSQGAAVRRVATFNVSSRREKSLSASISYTTAPPRMFTSKLCDFVTPYSLV